MESVQVSASQLLASFLGSEKEKIGQGIVQGDFSGELKKLMPQTANPSKIETGTSGKDAAAGSDKGNAVDSKLQTSLAKAPNAQSATAPANGTSGAAQAPSGATKTKNSLPSSVNGQKNATDSKSTITAIKEKARKEETSFVTNPAMAATVLADLQCPAETINACKDAQNKDGCISIKNLKTLLNTQPATASESSPQVPAEHARALLESIIAGNGGTYGKVSASGTASKSSVQIKTEGSYTPDEFRGLLEKVLQQTDTTGSKAAGLRSQPDSGEAAQTAQTIQMAQTLKTSQTENLLSSVLPSFITDRGNGLNGKILAADSVNPESEASAAKVSEVRENAVENVSDSLKSDIKQSTAKIAPVAEELKATVQDIKAAATAGISETSTGSAGASPAVQESSGAPVKNLDPVLKYFDASIVSSAPLQSEAKAAESPAVAAGPHEVLAAQAQNLAAQVKGVEKQADKPQAALSSGKLAQDITQLSDAARIKTVPTEFPSDKSSSDDSSNLAADSASNTQTQAQTAKLDSKDPQAQFEDLLQTVVTDGTKTKPLTTAPESQPAAATETITSPSPAADSASNTQTQAQTAKLDSKDSQVQFEDLLRTVVTDGKETKPVTTASESQPAAATETITSPSPAAGSTLKTQVQAPTAKLDSKDPQAQFGDLLQTVVTDGKATKPVTTSAESQPAVSDAVEIPVQQQGDTDSETGKSAFAAGSATSPEAVADAPQAAESLAARQGQDADVLAKQVEKQFESRNSSPESAIFQNSAPAHQGQATTQSQTDSSDGNGLAYYDPQRSAELVENMREQVAGAAGGQLVLEMEPDGLGKINVKVGAKKDEISVAALTQSEPAREVLMRHSPELRQNLQEQGLVLGKFSVDVNGGKSGGGNYHEANEAGAKITPAKETKLRNIQASETPVYNAKTVSRQSQISIFA